MGGNLKFLPSMQQPAEMKKYEEIKNIYSSDLRYKTAYDSLSKFQDDASAVYAKDILRGKYGFMCQYNKGLNFDTVWSSVFDINNKKIYRAEGNPSKIKFTEETRLELKY